MTGWFVDLLINKYIHHNFNIMAAFRFHPYYVNYPFLKIFWALLQNLQSKWISGDDVITAFYRSEIS